MPLNDDQKQKLQEWITSKGVSSRCPACGSNSWSPGDVIAPPVQTEPGTTTIGGATIPMVQLICSSCAHVLLFAAVPIGLP